MLVTMHADNVEEILGDMDNTGERVASEGSRTLVSLAERVAIVETKVGNLKDDTGVIRSTLHDVNNRMTEFVAAEIRCGDSLTAIRSEFSGLRADLNLLLAADQQGKGAWRAIGIVWTGLAGAMGAGAALASALWWLLHGH